MDNVQRQYLALFAAAQEKALSGDCHGCLQICFELRLKPDLALYTRALVCLSICDWVHVDSMPEKLSLAKEALRLIRELKDDTNVSSTLWAEYHQLELNAEQVVKETEEEELEYATLLLEKMQRDDGSSDSSDEDMLTECVEIQGEAYTLEEENETEVVGMPAIEGLFTLRAGAELDVDEQEVDITDNESQPLATNDSTQSSTESGVANSGSEIHLPMHSKPLARSRSLKDFFAATKPSIKKQDQQQVDWRKR